MTPLVALVGLLIVATVSGSSARLDANVAALLAAGGAGLFIVAVRLGWAGHAAAALGVAASASLAFGAGVGGVAEARAWSPGGVDLAALEEHVASGVPVRVDAVLRRDAWVTPAGGVMLDVAMRRVQVGGNWQALPAGARLTVAGDRALAARQEWTRGRAIEAPLASLRRPLPYRNFGIPDAERALARQGVRFFGGIKSAALVTTRAGPAWEEAAARARLHVRGVVASHVPHADAAAVVTAILIGDRSAMPAAVTRGLQHAGVYHVVAISGGNVGVWLALLLVLPRATALGPRLAMLWLAAGLLAFAVIVDGGASVVRAVLVAAVALLARWWDIRTTGLQALAVAAGVQLAVDPLSTWDAGCLLSFAAAGTLVWLVAHARRVPSLPAPFSYLLAMLLATLAIEVVLLPITATWFSVVTAAGVIANVMAIPAAAVVQMAGLVIATSASVSPTAGDTAGGVAGAAVAVLLRTGDIVTMAPWLVREVPPPSRALLVTYYGSLALLLVASSRRRPAMVVASGLVLTACMALIVDGGRETSAPAPWTWPASAGWQRASWSREPWLVVTTLDVGQGDAIVVRFPSGRTWLVDAGGSASESFDVGERVTSPALWALGHRSLSRVLVTHGHPDHAGGVAAVLRRLGARELILGIDVPGDAMVAALDAQARAAGIRLRHLRTGESLSEGPVRVHVLHPDPPDWERPRVRNDDSVVVWIRFGDVGLLLTGDVTEEAERLWAHRFAAAPLTILKLAHHGSASSTGAALLDAARPVLALGSMGRGNRFGHPAAAVRQRLADAGVALLRTDVVGAIQVATNGRVALVRTATGEGGSLSASGARRAWQPAIPLPSDRVSPPRAAALRRAAASPWP